MVGLSYPEFQKLWERVGVVVEQCGLRHGADPKKPNQRGSNLEPKVRLLLVLTFLKRYAPLEVLATEFGTSKSTVNEWLNVLVPRLAEYMKPEIQFPSEERLKELVGSISQFPEAFGHMDMTIHRMQIPQVEESRLFRGDKYCHFMNTLTMVDFTGSFLWVEPGFGGRLLDRQSFEQSELYKKLEELGKKTLADNGFKGQEHVITPPQKKTIGERMHKAERARQESTYQELHAQFAATKQIWRHHKSFHAPTVLLCCELFNFKKRCRMMEGLKLWEKFFDE